MLNWMPKKTKIMIGAALVVYVLAWIFLLMKPLASNDFALFFIFNLVLFILWFAYNDYIERPGKNNTSIPAKYTLSAEHFNLLRNLMKIMHVLCLIPIALALYFLFTNGHEDSSTLGLIVLSASMTIVPIFMLLQVWIPKKTA